MKKNLFKRGMAGLLSLVMCLTALVGIGTTTAYAAGERAEVYLVSFPRSGDANIDYSGTWGHPNLRYMNGWHSGESKYTTIRAMHSYDGNICYCIEPGVQQDTGDTYTSKDETFWDNLPSDINSTISPYDMKLFIGRIMQYGYTGPISTSWRSQNPADAATLAEAMATQVLIWETVVGERDEDFDYVSPGSYDAVKGVISTAHPLYDLFCDYYDSIEASVQRHSAIPSFMSKNPNRAQSVELEWDGSSYTTTLTDHNRVLSDYSFSANEDGISFSVSGNQLIITATDAPSDSVRITANKVGSSRRGVITWTDGTFNQGSGKQDVITYAQSVSDPVQAFLNLKVSYGSAKIVKTSEDGKVDNLTFTVTGNGVNQTVKTNSKGEIQIDNLMPGVYTVTEMDYDKYEPQESRRVTVVSGQVSTVTFNNKLKRGDLQIVKSSEDNLNEGVTFHLYGTSLSGVAVDEYAVTDANGVATFEAVLISGSTPYTVEEVDTAVRYVIPEAQSAPINWNEVASRSFLNILKKFSVTVTKSDAETGTAQGDASLAGAVYGIYKGETLVDTYTTDKNGQFVTKEYICDNDWTVREITPSEGYLLDTTVHKVGAEPQLYTVEHKITHPINEGNKKLIIFTAFADTAGYLYDNVSRYVKDRYGLNTAMVSGSVEGRTTCPKLRADLNTVLTCFSPISKDKELLMPGDRTEIDVLIATDCISEGQNLQDCDYLINYDIHWNPVRIIQRFGRIDRIGSRNKVIQLVNFWPDVTLDDYINLKAKVETRMKIVDMTATGDDNLLSDEEKTDLEYRKAQLKRLQDEVVDIEDMTTGISIMDLGLNEFRLDLLDYIKRHPDIDKTPFGLHSVVPASEDTPAGVIYVLKNRSNSVNIDNQNRLHPFYMVYIGNDGEVICDHLSPKQMLDKMRFLCKGKTEPIPEAYKPFNKETRDGRNMSQLSKLLGDAIASIIEVKDESDIDSFLGGGQVSFLSNEIKGLDDFELICFLVVR